MEFGNSNGSLTEHTHRIVHLIMHVRIQKMHVTGVYDMCVRVG